MSANWPYNIKHVTPGEPVQAGIVGRPDRTLEERTEYLKERLDAAELGRAIFEVDATVSPDVLPGQPVYWNWSNNRYEKALVAVEQDPTTQVFTVQPSSDCVGMCYRKKSADRADIVLRGLVVFNDLTNSIGETVEPGKYYLSAVEPGKLSKQKPPVTVVVCHVQGPRDNCSDKLRVVVMPQTKDYVEEHTHYRFDLIARPAGTNTIVADEDEQLRHEITDPNPDMQGWLPADHETFRRVSDDPTTNYAPPGAVFGYNLKKHNAINRVWPPIPIQSVSMIWDKSENAIGATEIPLGARGLAIADVNGIWWMSNCYGDVPWPAEYSSAWVDGDGLGAECPRNEVMRVVVIYLRMLLGNDRSVVTSLVQDVDEVDGETIVAPVAITNCDDLPASTGDLKLNVDLQFAKTEAVGGQAIKGVANRHQLARGWVAEGVVTTTPSYLSVTGSRQTPKAVTISIAAEAIFTAANHGFTTGTKVRLVPDAGSTLPAGVLANTEYFVLDLDLTQNSFKLATTANGTPLTTTAAGTGTFKVISGRYLTPAEKTALSIVSSDPVPVHQGLLRIDYTDELVEREISPQVIRLSDTVERLYMDIPYLGFPAEQNSLLRIRLNIPEVNTDQNLKMKVRVRLFGRGGNVITPSQLPTLYMSYRRLPRPYNSSLQLPTVDTDIDFSESSQSLPRDTVVECDGEEFCVEAGDTVLVTIERRDDNSYDNDVGVLRIAGIIRSDVNNECSPTL
jgi:hypothetical protein